MDPSVQHRSRWSLIKPTATQERCIITSRFVVHIATRKFIDVVRCRYYPGPGPVIHYTITEFKRLHKPL